MANNRLYFVVKRTGRKVFIGKYYPSTGWAVRNERLAEELEAAFDEDVMDRPMWDGGAHALEYEVDEED